MQELQVIEHKNIRVLTSEQLAKSYGTDNRVISNNFNNNKDRFEENRDYYCLINDELQTFKTNHKFYESSNCSRINKLYLWTERGCLKHSKSLGTDKAWEVYELLLDTYFRVKEQELDLPKTMPDALRRLANQIEKNQQLEKTITEQKPKVDFADRVNSSQTLKSVGEFAKMLGTGQNRLFKFLREHSIIISKKGDNYNLPHQKYIDNGYFAVKEKDYMGMSYLHSQTYLTGKGQQYVQKLWDATHARQLRLDIKGKEIKS